MTIGAAIIAKNESDKIEGLLSVISDFFNQIVLIDTGSTDNTPKIARKYGAEVYYKRWNANFSEARNAAINHMRTDWIFSIDCDEMIEPDDLQKLPALLTDENTGGINIKIVNNLGNGVKSVHHYTRLFLNNKRIRYQGRIHEQIRASIEALGLSILNSNIKIIHNGYFDNDIKKQMRNKELLLLDMRDNPDDDWLKYHLGNTEFAVKNFSQALELFLQVVNSSQLSVEQREMSALRISQISLENENFDTLYKYCNFESNNNDIEGLRLFIIAASYMIQGNLKESLLFYKKVSLIHSNLVNYSIVKDALRILDNNH